ncbi:MAG: hypothetical protein K5876_04800 [Ruminiclostridium sp.]|nr:hypothetical protein [Ruminiclostridium sp.]
MDNGIVAYQCPSCGAPLTYTAETLDFACVYCGSHFTKETLDKPLEGHTETISDEEAELYEKQKKFGEDNRLYLCPGCGAAIITESELSASAECAYCHSAVVLSGRLAGEYRPDKIIPFKKTRDDALAQFRAWTDKKKFFMAKGFGSDEALAKMQGIYIPFWLADCCVEGRIDANCYNTVSSVRKGDYIITTQAKYAVTREGSIIYQGVPADGSSSADDALMDSIEPFDYTELVDFDMSYLSGHSAQRYDVTKDMVFPRINARVMEAAEQSFLSTIAGYSKKDIVSKKFYINNINWQHVMLPLWFMSYKYKDKMYYFAMNAQTGKFGGSLPVNKAKLVLMCFGIPFLAVLLISLIRAFLGGLV